MTNYFVLLKVMVIGYWAVKNCMNQIFGDMHGCSVAEAPAASDQEG